MLKRRMMLAVAALGAAGGPATAQARFPTRPMRIVIPFATGGSTDILARLCAQILTERLGQSVVAENVTGAGGTIGAQRVLDAPADGYTLMAGTPGPITINPHLQARLPYAPLRDFEPVVFVGASPAVVTVRRDSPVRDLQELIDRARAAPGQMTYGSAGVGSFAHLSGALFQWRAGLDMVHIPYRGTAPAATDLMGGRLDVMFENYPSVSSQIGGGELRVLGLGATRRSAQLPGVPTVAEAGLPGYESTSWFGLFVRAGTPPAAIEAINEAIGAALREPAIIARLAALGIEPAGGTPASFRAFLAAKLEETGEVVRAARIAAE
jgi:tripartite-type tricarboxylate transporter receptor subunit TctC